MLSIRQRQQNLLTYYRFYTGNVDGIEGPLTKTAYRNFQKYTGLSVDGIYGNNTNNKLISIIKDLQSKLNNNGYNLAVDGIVGVNTINAVKDFQKKNSLVVDGIAGEKTFSKLEKAPIITTKYRFPLNYINITQYYSNSHLAVDLGWSSSYGGPNVPIYACYEGTVIINSYASDTGNYLAIRHDNGDVSRYLHLNSKSPLAIGTRVQKGEQVGIMGTTGHSTGNHLHFDLTRNGSRVNPLDYLYVYSGQIVSEKSKNSVRYI